jgi:RimJ/RimL family protein N-acetyltransferase
MSAAVQQTLVGPTVLVRPMTADDVEPLYAVASDPAIWAMHPESTRWQRAVFQRFADGALASGGGLVVERRDTGTLIGASRYYDWEPRTRSIVVGFTFLARAHWGDGTNAELKRLMLDHAFTFADAVWFHVGEHNLRSRRAVEKLGATLARTVVSDAGAVSVHYRLSRDVWHTARVPG